MRTVTFNVWSDFKKWDRLNDFDNDVGRNLHIGHGFEFTYQIKKKDMSQRK